MSAAELVLAARGGDATAFAQLVDAHRGLVATIALAIVRDVHGSEEIAQDVFVQIWRSLPRLRNPASFLPWLRQLTRNRAHRFVVERRRRPEPSEDALRAAIDPAPDPQETLARAEEVRVLGEALDALPDDAREVVTLFYREGRSSAQVAALLGLHEDAVRKRLSRARQLLREDLETRFASAAERTQPGPELTRAVLAALPVGAPAAAGLKLAALLAKPLFAALPGIAGGLIGVFGGLRSSLREARDDRERSGLKRAAAVQALAVIVFALAVPFIPEMPHSKIVMVLWTTAFMSAIYATCFLWIPRIVRPRLEAELRADPVGAASRHRRGRRRAILGAAAGFTLGWMPVIWYVFFR